MTTQNNLEIKGSLLTHTLAELLAVISQAELSGSLRFSNDDKKIIIYVEKGKIVFAVSNMREHRLFQILLDATQISKPELLKIEGFTNDLKLVKYLKDNEKFRTEEIKAFTQFQIKKIIEFVFGLKEGEWIFSPLARVKEGLNFQVDLNSLIHEHLRAIETEFVFSRFKSLEETFSFNQSNQQNNFSQNPPTPQEAFILSRLSDSELSLNEVVTTSGLSNQEVIPILYKLWICGFIHRNNWQSPFEETDLSKLSSSNYALKKSAISLEEEEQKKKEAEENARKEAEEAERKAKERERQKATYSLENYLKQVEGAATHYEMFDVDPEAPVSDIKNAYFSYAKKYHPDKYYKKVDSEKHLRIQNAFTEIANAYETLKDADSRELYDFRLRKAIEQLKEKNVKAATSTNKPISSPTKKDDDSKMAAESFDAGYDLILENKFSEAVPHLARAVHLIPDNARYHAFYGKALSLDRSQQRKAEAELQQAVNLDPKNSTYRIMLAELYIEIGLLVRAKGEINRLLKFDPNNQEAKSLLDSLTNK